MGALRKNINELLSVKTLAADKVWINNKALDAIEYRFSTGTGDKESWFIEVMPGKAASPNSDTTFVCLEGNASLWIENGFTFLGNLTGIFLNERHTGMLNLLAGKIPAPLQALLETRIISLTTPPEDACGLLIRYGTQDVCFQANVWMSPNACINFLSNRLFTYKAIDNPAVKLNWNLSIYVGAINIALSECSKLEAGDLLFFDQTHFNNNGAGSISFSKMRANVTLEERENHYQLTIQHWDASTMNTEEYGSEAEELITDEMTMSADDQDSAPIHSMKAPIADLPLKLNVKLGSIQFTLEDLGRMVEGKVYPIDSVCPGKVQLMANGIEVARGILVDVDGRLAVEIQHRWVQVQ